MFYISGIKYKDVKYWKESIVDIILIIISSVNGIIILISWSDRFSHTARDQSVSKPHPNTFPDILLDLVIILEAWKY